MPIRFRLLIPVLIVAASLLATATPADATLAGYRWARSTVCVADHTGSRWPVDSATYRWSTVPDLQFYYGRTCSQQITVVEAYYGRSGHWYRRAGESVIWLQPDVWGTTDKILRVTIRLNNSYISRLTWANRRSLIMHELGHSSGLAHTSYRTSLMCPSTMYWWSYPTSYDKSETDRNYPW
jgi:hypothetical protein